jgi:ribosomal protein S18 acetylase RimI-like enzyme
MADKTRRPVSKKAAGAEKEQPSEILIREMQLEDLHKVFRLGEEVFTAELWPNLYRTWDEYEVVDLFSSDGEFCLVAEQNERIVGFALGTYIDKRHSAWSYGYLLWLGVAHDVRRTGVGKRLLNRLTAQFIEEGARMMILDTEVENVGAIEFFQSMGFGNEVKHAYFSHNLMSHPEYKRKRARAKRREQGTKTKKKKKSLTPVMARQAGAAGKQR